MSSDSNIKLLAASFGMTVALASPAWAQVALICQTPGYWCTIPAPYAVNNESCYCFNYFGGTDPGYTIIPFANNANNVPAPLPVPNVQPTAPWPNTSRAPNNPPRKETATKGECLNGLGNCTGSYSGN